MKRRPSSLSEGFSITGMRAHPFFSCTRRHVSAHPAARLVLTLMAVWTAALPAVAQSTQGSAPRPPISIFETRKAKSSYVGDEACRSCHQTKTETYHQTAHAHTSSLPSANSIRGSFTPGSNILRTANPDLLFIMEVVNGAYYQKGALRMPSGQILERAERIDVIIGSGRKGQTHLFWDGDALFQLPVSYWTELGEWVNSPGYIDGTADFERPIAPRCLECHTSSFESRATPVNSYNRNSLTTGVSCEKCHGPAGEHVARYRSKTPPVLSSMSAIVNPARLSRERQLDICALCHAGIGNPRAPALSFVPGDVLNHFLDTPKTKATAEVDVHGSQVQLLERSRCFQSSPSMTCTTCHDVHTPQRDPAGFVSDCMKCHELESCGTFPTMGHAIDRQCITCHMPLQETQQIVISGLNGRRLQPKVRNHEIKIYRDINLP